MQHDLDSSDPLTPAQIDRNRQDGCIKLNLVPSADALAQHGAVITRPIDTRKNPLIWSAT